MTLVDSESASTVPEICAAARASRATRRTALDALGRRPTVVSGWWNWLRANLAMRLLPRPLVAHLARDVMESQTPSELR